MKSPAEQYAAFFSPSGCPPQFTSPSRSYGITLDTGSNLIPDSLKTPAQYSSAIVVASPMSSANSSGVSVPSGSEPSGPSVSFADGAPPPDESEGPPSGAETQPRVISAAARRPKMACLDRQNAGMRSSVGVA
jgi:hypothetical protein